MDVSMWDAFMMLLGVKVKSARRLELQILSAVRLFDGYTITASAVSTEQ